MFATIWMPGCIYKLSLCELLALRNKPIYDNHGYEMENSVQRLWWGSSKHYKKEMGAIKQKNGGDRRGDWDKVVSS